MVVVPTGLSERQFAERLENLIVRFSTSSQVDQAERDVVSQYRALATREARNSFLANLPNDPAFGRKARALAVRCLYSRGVSDYATLSVANRLTARDAPDLAKALLALPADAKPDEVRANRVLAARPSPAPSAARTRPTPMSPTGLHTVALHEPTMSFGLDVAPDGRTAVVTITFDANLEVGDKRNDFFGNALVQERITVDLAPDVPVVTDIRLSQE